MKHKGSLDLLYKVKEKKKRKKKDKEIEVQDNNFLAVLKQMGCD